MVERRRMLMGGKVIGSRRGLASEPVLLFDTKRVQLCVDGGSASSDLDYLTIG